MAKKTITPQEIAIVYLQEEFRKLFGTVTDENFWQQIDRSLASLPERLGEGEFWQVVGGISEGWKMNWVYRILTNDSFSWTEEEVPIHQIKLTGMGPKVDPLIKDRAESKAERFTELYRNNPEFRKAVEDTRVLSGPVRASTPIFLREEGDKLAVFNGMHLMLRALAEGKETMRAYVGRVTKPAGKMMVNPDNVYFLTLLFQESKDQEALHTHLVAIAREIIAQTRNGHDVWEERIGGWVRDDKVKGLVSDILGKNT